MPDAPAELAAHAGIALGGMQDTRAWRMRHVRHAGLEEVIPFEPCLLSDDTATLKAAACQSADIVALPGYVGQSEVKKGQLVRVLPQWTARVATISLLMPSRRGLLPSVRAFIDFLVEHVPIAVQ